MLATLIATGADLPPVEAPTPPRAGDTLGVAGVVWRVQRVHWRFTPQGDCEGLDLHVSPAALAPEEA